jgi:iron complex transport system substrate-binding protein
VNRKLQIILVTGVLAAVTAGAVWIAVRAAGTPAEPAGRSAGREVVDMTGRTVAVPTEPTHILSLCTSASDAMVALGEASRLAAIEEFGRVVPGVGHAQVIGKGSAISREQVLALGIDLAFVWYYQDDAAAMLEELRVPVVRVRTGRAGEVPAMIRLVGDCLNRQTAAKPLAHRVEEFLAAPAARAASGAGKPRVYLELYGPYKTVGRDSYMNDLLELAGADNIAADTAGTVLLSSERLIQADPDVILFAEGFADAEGIAGRPGMAGLKAVREHRVFPIDRRWLVAGPGLPEAVTRIREVLAGAVQNERH